MDFTIYEQAYEFIKKTQEALPEGHRDKEYFEKFLENMPKAKELADNQEKAMLLTDTAVKVANQLSFILFRENKLTEAAEREYRELPDTVYVQSLLEKVTKERVDAAEAVRAQMTEAQNAQKSIDIFTQVMAGLSPEEAEQRYNEYVKAGGR